MMKFIAIAALVTSIVINSDTVEAQSNVYAQSNDAQWLNRQAERRERERQFEEQMRRQQEAFRRQQDEYNRRAAEQRRRREQMWDEERRSRSMR